MFNLLAMACSLRAMASNLEAVASDLKAMASNLSGVTRCTQDYVGFHLVSFQMDPKVGKRREIHPQRYFYVVINIIHDKCSLS